MGYYLMMKLFQVNICLSQFLFLVDARRMSDNSFFDLLMSY